MANVLSWLTGREDKTGQTLPMQYDDGQPSLRAYNPSPSEQFSQWMSGLLGAGPGASLAKQNFATGVPSLLAATPLGIGLSAADLIHAKNANDPLGAAAAAIGLVPGLKPEVQAVRQGIRAYHGSPHDFDRFDISKIGTGEGAQAYGHGLYFAENEGVAKIYRNQLAPDGNIVLNNGASAPQSSPSTLAKTLGMGDEKYPFSYGLATLTHGKTPEEAIAHMQEQYGHSPAINAAVEAFQKYKPQFVPGKGRMYEVNINAKPEQFLDWDKPFAQQSAYVQNAVTQLYQQNWRKGKYEPKELSTFVHGGELYAGVAGPQKNRYEGAANSTAALREAGIPGIRYLDQGSRGPAAGGLNPAMFPTHQAYQDAQLQALIDAKSTPKTSNYVLFNDQLVDIMRKYGLAAPAAAGAASYAMQPQEAQAGKAQAAQFQQPVPLSDRINQMIDSLQWGDQWQERLRLPLERKVNQMLGESVWPPLH